MDICELLDLAKANLGLIYDAQLCRHLGKSHQSVNSYRRKKALPSDDTVVKLAYMAGILPIEALLNLNIWRSGPIASAIYSDHLQDLARKNSQFTKDDFKQEQRKNQMKLQYSDV